MVGLLAHSLSTLVSDSFMIYALIGKFMSVQLRFYYLGAT